MPVHVISRSIPLAGAKRPQLRNPTWKVVPQHPIVTYKIVLTEGVVLTGGKVIRVSVGISMSTSRIGTHKGTRHTIAIDAQQQQGMSADQLQGVKSHQQ